MGAVGKSKVAIQHCYFISSIIIQTSPSTSQALVSGAEQVAKLLSETLTNDTTEAIKIRPNIGIYNYNHMFVVLCMYMYVTMCVVIKAEQVSNDSAYEGYAFPDEDDNLTAYTGGNAQLMIPSELIQNISKSTYVAWHKNFNGCVQSI